MLNVTFHLPDTVNIAVGRPTYSTVPNNYKRASKNVVSGSRDGGTLELCYFSKFVSDPWWAVDLGQREQVGAVTVTAGDTRGKFPGGCACASRGCLPRKVGPGEVRESPDSNL